MQTATTYIETLQNIGKKINSVFASPEWKAAHHKVMACADQLEQLTVENRICDIDQAYTALQQAMQQMTDLFTKFQFSPNN